MEPYDETNKLNESLNSDTNKKPGESSISETASQTDSSFTESNFTWTSPESPSADTTSGPDTKNSTTDSTYSYSYRQPQNNYSQNTYSQNHSQPYGQPSYSQPQGGYYQNGQMPPAPPQGRPPQPPKSHGVLIVVLSLILGIVGGFFGGFTYTAIFGESTSTTTADSSSAVVEEAEDTESTEDADTSEDSSNTAEATQTASLDLTTDANGTDLTVEEIAAIAADSVVEITTEYVTTGSYMQQYVSSGAGSGVIISEDGYIITNYHVIEDATEVTVTTTDSTAYEAEIIGSDESLDIALLKIDATGLTPASIGDSDSVVVGETVVAIGNPLGQLGGTVTSGIISALDREITIDDETMSLLQTDAAINPGNSGGGLFNDQGQLIGIVNAKSSGDDVEGLGFAIPINDVVEILDDLLNYGYVRNQAYLGVSLVDISTEQMAMMYGLEETGTYIYSVEEGEAADEAGLMAGDRIISIDGTEITSADDVTSILDEHSTGDELTFVVVRYSTSEEMTIVVTVGEYVPETVTSEDEEEEETVTNPFASDSTQGGSDYGSDYGSGSSSTSPFGSNSFSGGTDGSTESDDTDATT